MWCGVGVGAGLPSDGASTARLLMDAETRTAFHFLISKRGGGGSSFFSSAAGPSLVSIALMAQGPCLDARRPSDAAARSAAARSSDADGPGSRGSQRARSKTRARSDLIEPVLIDFTNLNTTSGDSSLNWSGGVS